MKRMAGLAWSLALAGAGLAACAGGGLGGGAPAGASLVLEDSAWVLAALPGQDLAPGTPAATLRFAAGRAQGSDGCNRYQRSYQRSGAAGLRFDPAGGVATLMACPGPAEALSRGFAAALAATRSAALQDGQLQLLDEGGRVLARLQAQAQLLAGSRWEVLAYNNGRQAVVSLMLGSQAQLAFDAQGRLSGSGGCNQLMGQYQQQGEAISFSGVAATRRACLQPGGLMAQETAILQALESVASLQREGERLELRRADGALALSLKQVAQR